MKWKKQALATWELCWLKVKWLRYIVFLVHLSRRLKCTIVIMCCPSSVRRPSSLTFHIFDFSSETAEQNLTKLYRKVDLNVLYQVCVFRADRKKQDGRPGLWLAETLSTSPLKPVNGIQRNLIGSKISTSSTKFVFFGPIWKTRWPPWPLIGWDIFDFSSETAERNSTKLDRKQDLNVLYQVCVFRADRKNKMAALASDWLRHFRLTLWNGWTEFNETWWEARSQRPLPNLCFFRADLKNKMAALASDWLRHFWLLLWKRLNGILRNLTGSKISTSSTKFVFFRANRKNKMAALASDWLRHFRLLLWNRWTEFNKTWQEGRSQRPLPSLRFLGRSEKTSWPPWPLIGWDIFDFSSETAKRNSMKTWQEARSQHPLPSLSFSGRSVNKKCPPWLIPQKGGTLYSGARYVALWASCFLCLCLFACLLPCTLWLIRLFTPTWKFQVPTIPFQKLVQLDLHCDLYLDPWPPPPPKKK